MAWDETAWLRRFLILYDWMDAHSDVWHYEGDKRSVSYFAAYAVYRPIFLDERMGALMQTPVLCFLSIR